MDFALAEETWRIDAPLAIEERIASFTFARGWAFRVEDDAGAPVGVVLVADGTWTVRFEDPIDALAAANRLVVAQRVDPARVAPVARGGDLALAVDRGLVLGHDVWDEVAPALVGVDERGDDVQVVAPGAGVAHEIVVTAGRSAAEARRVAERVLEERVGWMREHAFDPASLLAADRFQPEALRTRLAELRTDLAWDRYAGTVEVTAPDRWLSYVRDPSGAWDRGARATVLAQGLEDERFVRRVVARERFPAGPDGVRRAPQRVDLLAAGATLTFDREGGGATLAERAVTDLRVAAVGGPARVVWLDVPREEGTPHPSALPVPDGFALDGVATVDGTSLEVVHLPLTGDQAEGRGDVRTYAVVLPEPLPEGETLDLRVSWRERHGYVHLLEAWNGSAASPQRAVWDLGTTTRAIRALPLVRTHAGPVAPATLRVGVRPWHAAKDKVAISGVRARTFGDGAYRWTEATADSGRPMVAVGQWKEGYEPGRAAFPAVRSLLRAQGSEVARALPIEVRALLHGWQRMLPPYPGREVGVTELHMHVSRLEVVIAGGGTFAIHPMRELAKRSREASLRHRLPHFEAWALATLLHAHWWIATGEPPGSAELVTAVPAAFGIRTVGALHGPEDEDRWFRELEARATLADRRAEGWEADAFRVGRTLPALVGDPAVYRAVDLALSGAVPPTAEGLEQAVEAASGREVSWLFALWRSGLAPEVRARHAQDAHGVRITLETDLPFGTLSVPVRLRGRGEAVDVWVDLVDGRGEVAVPWTGELRGLEVDPDHLLLLAGR